jgi:hypothetical protein
MRLHQLHCTPCLTIYYDLRNDWLYLDWQGHVTLPLLQEACLQLAQCFQRRPYARVLNNNEQVTGFNWSIGPWLVTNFLPHMPLAGIKQVAWVPSATLQGKSMMQLILNLVVGSLITCFTDLPSAVVWMKQTRPQQEPDYLMPQHTPATQAQLAAVVQALYQRRAPVVPTRLRRAYSTTRKS